MRSQFSLLHDIVLMPKVEGEEVERISIRRRHEHRPITNSTGGVCYVVMHYKDLSSAVLKIAGHVVTEGEDIRRVVQDRFPKSLEQALKIAENHDRNAFDLAAKDL